MYVPDTEDRLWGWLRMAFGVAMPRKVWTPGHSSPFAFLWDAYSNPAQDVAAWACRSGGKTLGASLLAALEYGRYDNLQARVLSGSEDQAKFLYGYWSNWCNGYLKGRVQGEVNRLLTRVAGGQFEILAASQKKVRGGKVQRLFEDEVDEIDPELDAAAVGMIDSRPGLPGRTIYTSTWHRPNGPMGKLIDGCPGNGVRLHKWNIWEAIARCTEDRHRLGGGCVDCPLGKSTGGKPGPCVLKAQEHFGPNRKAGVAADADGIYQVDDAIKAFSKVGLAVWEAEYECKRPSIAGLVYPEFDATEHACKTVPQYLTYYRAIDWGFNVFVCLWLGVDKEETVYVLDTYAAEQGPLRQHADYIKAHKLTPIQDTYCDPAGMNKEDQTGKSNIDQFRAWGIPCTYMLSAKWRNVQNGLKAVRELLRPASGRPRLYYVQNEHNKAFITAMQSYHHRKVNGVWIDEPQEPQEHEHIPDALRYFVVNRQVTHSIVRVGLGAH